MKGPAKLVALLLALSLAPACRPLLRYPAEAPERAAWTRESWHEGMDPFLLTSLVASDVVVEVDWVEGCRPTSEALSAFERTLGEHTVPGRRVRIELDEEIPRARWLGSASGRRGAEDLVADYVDHDPAAWEREELLYVLYAPESGRWFEPDLFGLTTVLVVGRGGEPHSVRALMVFQEPVERAAALWITAPKIERATLIHELGHTLGLVARPDHVQRGSAGHCTDPRCVLSRPGARSVACNALPALFAGRIPDDFCSRCKRDLAEARDLWTAAAARDSDLAASLAVGRRAEEYRAAARWCMERGRAADAFSLLARARDLDGGDGSRFIDPALLRDNVGRTAGRLAAKDR